jgi:hypothetical protein
VRYHEANFVEKRSRYICFLKKQMSGRKVVDIVGVSQSKVNRIRKKHFENIVMSKGGRPQALITWEKIYVVRLITIHRLDSALEATKEFKSGLRVDVYVE